MLVLNIEKHLIMSDTWNAPRPTKKSRRPESDDDETKRESSKENENQDVKETSEKIQVDRETERLDFMSAPPPQFEQQKPPFIYPPNWGNISGMPPSIPYPYMPYNYSSYPPLYYPPPYYHPLRPPPPPSATNPPFLFPENPQGINTVPFTEKRTRKKMPNENVQEESLKLSSQQSSSDSTSVIAGNKEEMAKSTEELEQELARKIYERRQRKNLQSRIRAAKLRERIEVVKTKSNDDRRENELKLLELYEDRRCRKNQRSRERANEKKREIERILAISENVRSKEEQLKFETAMKAKHKKNEGDRIRRERIKRREQKEKPAVARGRPKKNKPFEDQQNQKPPQSLSNIVSSNTPMISSVPSNLANQTLLPSSTTSFTSPNMLLNLGFPSSPNQRGMSSEANVEMSENNARSQGSSKYLMPMELHTGMEQQHHAPPPSSLPHLPQTIPMMLPTGMEQQHDVPPPPSLPSLPQRPSTVEQQSSSFLPQRPSTVEQQPASFLAEATSPIQERSGAVNMSEVSQLFYESNNSEHEDEDTKQPNE